MLTKTSHHKKTNMQSIMRHQLYKKILSTRQSRRKSKAKKICKNRLQHLKKKTNNQLNKRKKKRMKRSSNKLKRMNNSLKKFDQRQCFKCIHLYNLLIQPIKSVNEKFQLQLSQSSQSSRPQGTGKTLRYAYQKDNLNRKGPKPKKNISESITYRIQPSKIKIGKQKIQRIITKQQKTTRRSEDDQNISINYKKTKNKNINEIRKTLKTQQSRQITRKISIKRSCF